MSSSYFSVAGPQFWSVWWTSDSQTCQLIQTVADDVLVYLGHNKTLPRESVFNCAGWLYHYILTCLLVCFRRPCSDHIHVTAPYKLSFYYYYLFCAARSWSQQLPNSCWVCGTSRQWHQFHHNQPGALLACKLMFPATICQPSMRRRLLVSVPVAHHTMLAASMQAGPRCHSHTTSGVWWDHSAMHMLVRRRRFHRTSHLHSSICSRSLDSRCRSSRCPKVIPVECMDRRWDTNRQWAPPTLPSWFCSVRLVRTRQLENSRPVTPSASVHRGETQMSCTLCSKISKLQWACHSTTPFSTNLL